MRRRILSLAFVAVAALVTTSRSEAALITFDLNASDAALQGTTVPYATVTVSTQGTGTATFDVVADGPYSLASIFFQINPNIAFRASGKATITGGVSFGGFDPTRSTSAVRSMLAFFRPINSVPSASAIIQTSVL